MDFRDEIKQYTLNEFSFLSDNNLFSNPMIAENVWITEIAYLRKEFAIVIYLDFYDFVFYVCLEKLQNGKRVTYPIFLHNEGWSKYLLALISDKKWVVDEELICKIRQLNKKRNSEIKRQQYFEIILMNKAILDSSIPFILEQESTLFD